MCKELELRKKSQRRWFEEMKFTPIFVSLENKRCLFFGQENTFILAVRKKVTSASNISLHRIQVAPTFNKNDITFSHNTGVVERL